MILSPALLSGCRQVGREPTSLEIMMFSTLSFHYEWLRMLFGLKSAPLTFQRIIKKNFLSMLGNVVFAYFDDLIIASKDLETHSTTLKHVLQRLEEAGLEVELSKREFLKAKI